MSRWRGRSEPGIHADRPAGTDSVSRLLPAAPEGLHCRPGAPLFARSTEVLSTLYRLTGGTIPLIGAGGIASAEDALAKIRAGASAVQLYPAMIFEGVSPGARIARGLDGLLEARGATVAEMVGVDVPLARQV